MILVSYPALQYCLSHLVKDININDIGDYWEELPFDVCRESQIGYFRFEVAYAYVLMNPSRHSPEMCTIALVCLSHGLNATDSVSILHHASIMGLIPSRYHVVSLCTQIARILDDRSWYA